MRLLIFLEYADLKKADLKCTPTIFKLLVFVKFNKGLQTKMWRKMLKRQNEGR